jgi:sugar lactone lactonase YvrE
MDVEEIWLDEADVALEARAEVGEGPLWDDRDGVLWWVDIMRGHVHRFDPDTGQDRVFEIGQPVGAVALRRSGGGLVLAVKDGFVSLDPVQGSVDRLADVEKDRPGNRMNDGYCDPQGRFWAGTMAIDEEPAKGALYRLDPDRSVTRMLVGVGISNGIDWSPDGGTMYYSDSLVRRVDAFDFDGATGSLTRRRPFVTFSDAPGDPDGLVVDAEGCCWLAVWNGWQLQRYRPEGRIDLVVHLPAARVTKCAFGGKALDELYITTARIGLDGRQRAAQPLAGSVFRCRPGIRGRAPGRYAG